jgi:glutamine synthetase
MVNTEILPPAYEFQVNVASGLDVLLDYAENQIVTMTDGVVEDRKELFTDLSNNIYYIRKNVKELNALIQKANGLGEIERADLYFNEVKPVLEHIRKHVDELESVMPDSLWDLPKYKEMLFIA